MSATATRDRKTGRYAPRRTHPCCEHCGSTLAENLLGQLRCVRRRCPRYREVAGVVPGVDVGGLDEQCLVDALADRPET